MRPLPRGPINAVQKSERRRVPVEIGRVANGSDLTVTEEARQGNPAHLLGEHHAVVVGFPVEVLTSSETGEQQCSTGYRGAVALAKHAAKILIARALINYANSWTLGRLGEREIQKRLIAQRHSASLESSVNALRQWENLIGVPLGQLVMLHGSGITTEEIAALINALGLGAIAVGVN